MRLLLLSCQAKSNVKSWKFLLKQKCEGLWGPGPILVLGRFQNDRRSEIKTQMTSDCFNFMPENRVIE